MSDSRTPPKDIHARVPVDRVAARVVRPGTHFVPNRQPAEQISDVPLPMRKPTRGELMNPESFQNLAGHSFDQLTVIGLAAGKINPSRWVCRCTCGRYVYRTARTLKRKSSSHCDHCEYHRKLRDRSTFIATGQYHDEAGMPRKMFVKPPADKPAAATPPPNEPEALDLTKNPEDWRIHHLPTDTIYGWVGDGWMPVAKVRREERDDLGEDLILRRTIRRKKPTT